MAMNWPAFVVSVASQRRWHTNRCISAIGFVRVLFAFVCWMGFFFVYHFYLIWFSIPFVFPTPLTPISQEYTEEFRDIAKGNKSKEALPAAPITLIHQRPVGEELPVCMSFIYLIIFFGLTIIMLMMLLATLREDILLCAFCWNFDR